MIVLLNTFRMSWFPQPSYQQYPQGPYPTPHEVDDQTQAHRLLLIEQEEQIKHVYHTVDSTMGALHSQWGHNNVYGFPQR